MHAQYALNCVARINNTSFNIYFECVPFDNINDESTRTKTLPSKIMF